MVNAFVDRPCVAYFSMEFALHPAIPTYSGGLGILAGDTLRSAADLDIPLVGVTLVSRTGYFRQEIDADGRQQERPMLWDVTAEADALDAKVAVSIEGRTVWIGGWLYVLQGHMGGRRPVILLDTALDENDPADRSLTDALYGGDHIHRLKQEVVLGIGGTRMLQALGFRVQRYHMNEGHSALLALELLRRHAIAPGLRREGEAAYDVAGVRALCCFTTHTPVEAGHDQFPYDIVENMLGDDIPLDVVKAFGGHDQLNMTRLALNLSEYVNGVAKRHAEVSGEMFPGYTVHAITNGVHPFTWASPPFRDLYDRYLPGWCHEPELLVRAECCLPDDAIRQAHFASKERLLKLVEILTGRRLDPWLPILGFARRMTAYKRPTLLFTDLDRLRRIAATTPFQIVLAGKAHPHDTEGKELIRIIHQVADSLNESVPVVFLPDYDMAKAQVLVAGVDVWLNTPAPPMEASGTSGMKASYNGVPNLSVLDGWWLEGCIEGVTGWAIGDSEAVSDHDDANSLYDKLEQVTLPLYHDDPDGWIDIMKGAISKNAGYFHGHRVMRRYVSEAYLR